MQKENSEDTMITISLKLDAKQVKTLQETNSKLMVTVLKLMDKIENLQGQNNSLREKLTKKDEGAK